ncbi:hypothetical protein [Halorubrum sp. AS12]|uniref:hypothetical protein n=1 Tax=Halorubrum sp. AS12 TaxID=3409687 RepID=UPI003DA73648
MSEQTQPTLDDDAVVSKKDKMEKLQYPADREFEKIIDDYLSMDAILDHHKTQRGLLTCSRSRETIREFSRRVLFGYDSFKYLQKEALDSDTTTKSSAFRWSSEADAKELLADLKEKKRTQTAYGEKEVHVRDLSENGDDLELQLEFTIEKRGKLQGLARHRKSTSITIQDFNSDKKSIAIHEYDKVNKETAIREFIDGWNQDRMEDDKEGVTREPIALTQLSHRKKVELLRDLMKVETDNWTRKNVEGVQVLRDETVGGEDETEELDTELEGIRNAVLSGQRLDTNDFVQKCEENGYYLSKLEIRYEHKSVARRAVIEIDFKEERRETFEVSVNKTLINSDSGWVTDDFSMTDRREIREEFRQVVLEKFDEHQQDDSDFEL